MTHFLKEFEQLKIQLKDIKSATYNFDKAKIIGCGGFGKVYKGEVSHFEGRSVVAIKRLDRQYGQGDPEFLKEIIMLSRYSHENLLSLLGFCDMAGEKILVYEHALNGSLDRHLCNTTLTWAQRIKICLDAAKGLAYLHGGKGTQQRVIHRDIKSSNILLDGDWNAKISDMGLSKLGPANQERTAIFTTVVGTLGYLDPMYMESGVLTKESDVYSFGVVLFEVLCGRLCFENCNGVFPTLVRMWKQSYTDKMLSTIIFQDLKQPMCLSSVKTFSDIAFQCLHEFREERPTMSRVVEELEIALELQEPLDLMQEEYKEILKNAIPPIHYKSFQGLIKRLSKGVFVNGGNTWFSINEKREHYLTISIKECLVEEAGKDYQYWIPINYNRFPAGLHFNKSGKFETRVRTRFLSPHITYMVNIICRINFDYIIPGDEREIYLQYKLDGDITTLKSYLAYKKDDGKFHSWKFELCQLTTDDTIVDLRFSFEQHSMTLIVEGFEFDPLRKVECQASEDVKVDMQSLDDSYWEKKLPTDYKDIIKWSVDSLRWATNKELYSTICKGFLINSGEQWFSLDKNGKKCLMLSPKVSCKMDENKLISWQSLPKSRFGEVLEVPSFSRCISLKGIKSQVLSPLTRYASYLIYTLPEDNLRYEGPLRVRDTNFGSHDWIEDEVRYIYFVSPKIPVIVRGKVNENAHNPVKRLNIKGHPQQRSDGWMEVQVYEFKTDATKGVIPSLNMKSSGDINGLIIQGIELRPL